MAKQQKSAWVYLIAGLIIGLFVAFLVFLSQQDGASVDIKTAIEDGTRNLSGKDAREVREDPNNAPDSPKFDFYKMLPELQVNVSPNLDVNIGKKPAQVPTPPAKEVQSKTGTGLYYLQVGAFSKFESADQQKAGLVLQNWPTRLQQIRKDDGRSIYRILVGPYNDDQELNNAEKGLKKQGLKPVRQQAKS